jgi:hypothetical protein
MQIAATKYATPRENTLVLFSILLRAHYEYKSFTSNMLCLRFHFYSSVTLFKNKTSRLMQ